MVATLFPIEQEYPDGFIYRPDFISTGEETDLLTFISTLELHQFIFQGYTANRKVLSFGYDYSFDKRSITKGKDIPKEFQSLIDRVAEFLKIPPADFAELLVTEYPVGSVINWHRDAPPFDLIAGISLNTDCKFKLRPQDKKLQTRSSLITIPVKRRSLYILQGPSRSEWQHSTAPVKEKRYSITLRTLRQR
ncbi:MAG: alpha-ketoglutarate-dependent dioxygenase AlkB [Candidatus Dadabacteria bacterium]